MRYLSFVFFLFHDTTGYHNKHRQRTSLRRVAALFNKTRMTDPLQLWNRKLNDNFILIPRSDCAPPVVEGIALAPETTTADRTLSNALRPTLNPKMNLENPFVILVAVLFVVFGAVTLLGPARWQMGRPKPKFVLIAGLLFLAGVAAFIFARS